MKIIALLILLLIGMHFITFSQDVIVKTSGSTIKCKVVEVGLDIIKYKRVDNIEGPDYFIDKASVVKIKYENGTTDTFDHKEQRANNKKLTKGPIVRKGYIALTLGPAFPVGDFGSGDLNNPKAGLAKTGFQFNLVNFGYRFSNNIGIAALWNGAAHTMKYTDDGIWSVGFLGGGLMITFPSEKVDFDIRIMGGFLSSTASIPSLNFKSDGFGFGYDIGGVVRIHLGKVISLLITTDFTGGKPTFNSVNYQNFEQSITTINITGGIAFRLR